MMHFDKTALLLCGFLLAIPVTAALAGEAKSGYEFIRPATRATRHTEAFAEICLPGKHSYIQLIYSLQ